MLHSPSLMLRMARSIRDHCSAVHAIFVAELKESNNGNTDVYLCLADAACLSTINTEFTACAQLSVEELKSGCVTAVDAAFRPTKHLALPVNWTTFLYHAQLPFTAQEATMAGLLLWASSWECCCWPS